jgi:hypothetical protein
MRAVLIIAASIAAVFFIGFAILVMHALSIDSTGSRDHEGSVAAGVALYTIFLVAPASLVLGTIMGLVIEILLGQRIDRD